MASAREMEQVQSPSPLRALGVGPGDEVLTVANTAVCTVSAIRMVGATPVFCEVDPENLLIDPIDAESRITAATRAIVPVHLFGNAADMVGITRLAQQHGLRVVEDCAQAFGTLLGGRAVGTWGDVGCFSYYPTKNLGAYGDGGLCFTCDAKLADSMRQIRNCGCGTGQIAEREGVNSRLDELQAAILEVKLRHLPEYLRRRRDLAASYSALLSSRSRMPSATPGAQHTYHLLVVQTPRREHVISRLSAGGIECGIHYPTPIHLMTAYRFLGYQPGALPVTEAASRQVLSLPLYPELSLEDVERVCCLVNDATKD